MTETRPPRRPRYGGTHPLRLDEKYKELRGDPDAVARATERGHTPAGQHRPIMVDEVLEALGAKPGHVIVDCTLGYGGHTEALAGAVTPGGRVIGLDLDKQELARTQLRLAGLPLTTHAINFAGLAKVLRAEALENVDGVLADLGVSSMQLDRPERGFSLKSDGPIDMRMDASRGNSAGTLLAAQTPEKLADLLWRFGDEPDAVEVAAAIVAAFQAPRPPRRTRELVKIILAAKGIDPRSLSTSSFRSHPAARTFQAIRIAVNREDENLAALLRALPAALRPGGRAVILTFHSGEEGLVRAAFEKGLEEGTYANIEVLGRGASPAEVGSNPRARSARLMVAERA